MQKNAASVQSMTRDLEKLSVPTEAAGFLTCGSAHAAAFPMHSISDIKAECSPFTVTRSYRTYTCFPFNLRSYKTPSAPVVYYSISYRIPLFFQLYNTSGYFFIKKSHRGSRYKNNANSTLLSGAPTAASGTAPAIDHGISGAMTTALSSR